MITIRVKCVSVQNRLGAVTTPHRHEVISTVSLLSCCPYLLGSQGSLLLVDIQVLVHVLEGSGAGYRNMRLRVQDYSMLVHGSNVRGVHIVGLILTNDTETETNGKDEKHASYH